MRKLAALAGATALGLGLQSGAHAYNTQARVVFTVGGSQTFGAGSDQTFVATAAPLSIGGALPTNSTLIHTIPGANSRGTYNQNFAQPADCAAGAGVVPGTGINIQTRKYGCRYTTSILNSDVFAGIPVADDGPVLRAYGTVTVTDTTLTGTLYVTRMSDEATGATTVVTTSGGVTTRLSNSIGDGYEGYNFRSADGSPFGNYWQGISIIGTYTLNLTGTFNASTWTIDGGAATFSDPAFACQQGGFGGDDRGTLCTASTAGGGFTPTGGGLSWGLDPDGVATGTTTAQPIEVRDGTGVNVLATLSGVVASLSINGSNIITTNSGEIRRGLGNVAGGCSNFMKYDVGTQLLTCGNLGAAQLVVGGVVAPEGSADTDGDGVVDPVDNCLLTKNDTQYDSDNDGHGNRCDADLTQDGFVTSADFGQLRTRLNQSARDDQRASDADMSGDFAVTALDFGLLRQRLSAPLEASGLSCAPLVNAKFSCPSP